MSRNFEDFLSTYIDYARNEYAPEHFTRWVGLSVLAGALERKVWIQERGNYCNYPNLFVILSAGPGIGKSSAIKQGMPLLYGVQKANQKLKLLEGVTSAAGLRKDMLLADTFPGTSEIFNSVYLIGREGSESPLKNHGDDFRSMACQMYDCEDSYQFNTAKDGRIKIARPVMNMIVGATFDFLGSVVDQNTVYGGLASRFTYVIEKKDKLTGNFFDLPVETDESKVVETGDVRVKEKLIEDLTQIHRMYGAIRVERGAIGLCEEWFKDFKDEFNSEESSRMKAINIRKRTLLKKLLIIISASRRSSLILREQDAADAIDLVEEVTKDNPYIMAQAAMAQIDTQHGTTQLLIQTLRDRGGKMAKKSLMGIALGKGNNIDMVNKTFEAILASGWATWDSSSGMVELTTNPDRHL